MAIEGVVNWVHAICEYFTAKTYSSNLWKFSPKKETCYTVYSKNDARSEKTKKVMTE